MKSPYRIVLLALPALVLAYGCSDPDAEAIKKLHTNQQVVAPPPSDPAAQKEFEEYMKQHPEAAEMAKKGTPPSKLPGK